MWGWVGEGEVIAILTEFKMFSSPRASEHGINYDPVGWVIEKHLLWQDGRQESPCVSGLILIFGIHIALSTWQNLIDQTANEGRTSES